MFKKTCISLGMVFSFWVSNAALANICGDGGTFVWEPNGNNSCYGGSQGNRPFGTHPRDGLGPLPVDNRGGNATNNSGGGGRTVVRDSWGAVAFDNSRNSYGYSVGLSTRADAEQSAISDCGGGSCKTLSTFKNSCAALAGGRNRSGGAYVSSEWHPNPKIAEQLALTACSKKAKNCQILMSECSLP